MTRRSDRKRKNTMIVTLKNLPNSRVTHSAHNSSHHFLSQQFTFQCLVPFSHRHISIHDAPSPCAGSTKKLYKKNPSVAFYLYSILALPSSRIVHSPCFVAFNPCKYRTNRKKIALLHIVQIQ